MMTSTKDATAIVLLVAGLAYALWPPPAQWRGLWLLVWLAVSLSVVAGEHIKGHRPAPTQKEPSADADWLWNAQLAHDFRTPLMHLRLYLSQLGSLGRPRK